MSLVPRWRYLTDEAKALTKRTAVSTQVALMVPVAFRALVRRVAQERIRTFSPRSFPVIYGSLPRSAVVPDPASSWCCRSTRPEDRQRPERPERVGRIPSSDGPSRRLLVLFPDPLQVPSDLSGAGGDAQDSLAEQGGQAPELDPSTKGKDRPGQQHQERVAHRLFNAHRSAPRPVESPTIVSQATALWVLRRSRKGG